jgi:UDP-N-acetylmuramoyl-tripeptide--D-alanyl-D-alanine ligase
MEAALKNFSNIEADRKYAMLGDMLELGDDSLNLHLAVLDQCAASGFERVFLVGKEFGDALRERGDDDGFLWFRDSASLAEWCASGEIQDAVVLIKGSRGTRMEKVIPSL